MADENMKKALQSRRGKGIDISVVLGPHEMEEKDKKTEESKKSDLAPPSNGPLDVDHAAGVPSIHPVESSPLSELKDSDLLNGMSEHDKKDTSERAPRSLMERARQAMMKK